MQVTTENSITRGSRSSNKSKKYGFLLLMSLVILTCRNSVIGQNRYTYIDSLKIFQYKGVANFTYYKHKDDTILDGSFNFKSASLNVPNLQKPLYLELEGEYNDNVPTGNWEMILGNYSLLPAIGYDRNIFLVKVNGEKINLKGEINKTNADGIWTMEVYPIKSSMTSKIGYGSLMTFKNGELEGAFKLSDSLYVLEGSISGNGYPNSLILRNSSRGKSEISEEWNFDQGKLTSFDLLIGDSIININLSGGNNVKSIERQLNSEFLNLLKLKLEFNKSVDYDFKGLNNLLKKNDDYISRFDSIFSALGITSLNKDLKVRVAYFPYTKKEIQSLDSISMNFEKSSEIIQESLNHSTLAILQHSNPSVHSNIKTLEQLKSMLLLPLERLVNMVEDSALLFLERKSIADKIFPPSSVKFLGIENELKKIRENEPYTGLEEVALISSSLKHKLLAIERDLELVVQDYKRNETIEKLEMTILSQVDSIEMSLDLVKMGLPEKFHSALDSIDSFVLKSLNEYLENSTGNNGLAEAERELQCLLSANKLVLEIANIPKQLKQMEEHYTEVIWNPFTQTNMEEIQKKRILMAYQKILMDYFISFVTHHVGCENITQLTTFPDKLFGRIFELRSLKTKSIENKLRYELSVEEMEELFKIDIPN